MNINNAFPSKYLKSGDIEGDADLLLTIDHVAVESVGQDDPEDKPIVYFREVDKGLVLNKTNASTIASLYGPETDGWVGKRIALYATEVAYQGKMTLSLRVRIKAPASAAPLAVGNGTVINPKERWEQFCTEHNITRQDVTDALGTEKVTDWLKGMTGATLDDAMTLILNTKQAEELAF
jgi:hypothetical protein